MKVVDLAVLILFLCVTVQARPTFDKMAELFVDLVADSAHVAQAAQTAPAYNQYPARHRGAYEHGHQHRPHGSAAYYPAGQQTVDGYGATYYPPPRPQVSYQPAPQPYHPQHPYGQAPPYQQPQPGYGYDGAYDNYGPHYQSPPYSAGGDGYGYQQPPLPSSYTPQHGYKSQGY